MAKGKKDEIGNTNIVGSTGNVGEVKAAAAAKIPKAAGTGSNDEVINITVGKAAKKKR